MNTIARPKIDHPARRLLVANVAQARDIKARRAARYAIGRVQRGQMGLNLIQGFAAETGVRPEEINGRFVLDYLGYRTRPCLTQQGAIVLWAHLVGPNSPVTLASVTPDQGEED